MENNLFCVLMLVSWCTALPLNDTITYDQRQTGDYNIHISLKDIKIVALLNSGLGGSEDYDYNYDYAEMTVKPSPGDGSNGTGNITTSTSPSTTIQQDVSNITTTTEKVVEITPHPQTTTKSTTTVTATDTKNATKPTVNEAVTPKPDRPLVNSQNIPVQIILTPVDHPKPMATTKKPTQTSETSTALSSTTLKTRQAGCIEGYVKDRQGICRPRIKKPQQQSLLRKLIQLSQRSPLK